MKRRGIIKLVIILAVAGLLWSGVRDFPAWRVRQAGLLWTGTSGPMRGVFDKPSGTLWVIHQNRNDEWNQRVVTRLDTKTMRVKRRYRFEYDVDDLRYLESENMLYLICSRDKLLVSVDARTGRMRGSAEFKGYPTCLAVSEDREHIFVCTGDVPRGQLSFNHYPYWGEEYAGRLVKLKRESLEIVHNALTWSGSEFLNTVEGTGRLIVTSGREFQIHAPPDEQGHYVCCDWEDLWFKHQVFDADTLEVKSDFISRYTEISPPEGNMVIAGGGRSCDRPPVLVDLETGETTEIPLPAEKYVATNDVAISKKLNKGFLLLQQRYETGESEGRAADILVLNLNDMSTYIHETPIDERFFQLFLDEANDQLILLRNQRQGLPLVKAGMVTVSPIP